MIKGLNHITISVSSLEKSILFYQHIFNAQLIMRGENTAYFSLNGIWLALNEERLIERNLPNTYTHLAFTVEEADIQVLEKILTEYGAEIEIGRKRASEEKSSLYFRDPDGHLFEFHTGNLDDRLQFYRKNPNMTFY
ncbi:metallothiol transferase FosB [Bacillus sp. 1P06AnD]|uniref:metallothiol transferase FosB n=1 Tax=Bacillus sp. 1P06AnD TaxID=3132208 RepID=UPI0039A213A9